MLGQISEKYIVLYDSISDTHRDELYGKINSVENLARLYIKLSDVILKKEKDKKINKKNEMKMMLDMNALKINTENNKIDLINNDLYDLDFIKLLDKLSNPLFEKSFADLMEKIDSLDSEGFIRTIADLSSLDDNIQSISFKWEKLYNIRTMVAHNFIMDKDSYIEYINLYEEANEEIKKAVYKLFTENLIKESFQYEQKFKNYTVKVENYNKEFHIELKEEENIKKSYRIEKYEFCKVLNYIFNIGLNEYSFILNKYTIDQFKNLDNISEITDDWINNILEENKIKYKEKIISEMDSNKVKLERAINELLKQISEKCKD